MYKYLNLKHITVAGALLIFTMLPVSAPNGNKLGFEKEKPSLEEFGAAVEIQARSSLVLDLLTDEIIFEKNIYEALPLASLSKIISSLVAVDHLSLDEYIEVTKKAVETPEPSTLKIGEHVRAEDLLAMAMGGSSNDAMMALIEKLGDEKWFVELMHQKATELGTKTTSFLNPTGLDITDPNPPTKVGVLPLRKGEKLKEVASNYGSVYDLAQIVKNSLDSVIWQVGNKEEFTSKEGIAHKIKHTNILRNELTGIYGAKTGFTDTAGGNLILIIEHPLGKPKLIIILGSTLEGRFEDAKKILNFISSKF